MGHICVGYHDAVCVYSVFCAGPQLGNLFLMVHYSQGQLMFGKKEQVWLHMGIY